MNQSNGFALQSCYGIVVNRALFPVQRNNRPAMCYR